ncbi:hypothetical protein [Microvirga sp. M2]|uniref:hypothetical protein n=1 Tax=Microvirga sp. M2 TaxID=3073270 RepID=UPI0039C2779F
MQHARAEALSKGFNINAPAIRRPGSGRPGGPGGQPLEDDYARNVIGGPGSSTRQAGISAARASRPSP